MDADTRLKTEEKIIAMLKTVYDPEIPVNIYDLGLIYKIDLQDDGEVVLDMTLTAPNCPAADFIMEDVRQKCVGTLRTIICGGAHLNKEIAEEFLMLGHSGASGLRHHRMLPSGIRKQQVIPMTWIRWAMCFPTVK